MPLWLFRLTDDGTFVSVPLARFERFFDGRDEVPAGGDGFLRTADVVVTLQDHKPIAATIYGFFRYRVLANGRIDPAHREDASVASMALVEASFPLRKEDGNVIGAKRFADRYMDSQHRWKPTPAQLKQLVDAVNKRAKTKLL